MPANIGLWGGVACLLGFHVRSRGQAHVTPDGWVSRCARCAIPMVRAHGGGKWQVVKTPKRKKPGATASSKELLEKAIVKSKVAGARKEKKEVLAAEKALADEAAAKRRHVYGDAVVEDEPVKPKRRFLRRKKSADGDAPPRPRKRRSLFRRKAVELESEGVAEPLIDAQRLPQPGKARRGLSGRRKKPAPESSDAAGSPPA